MEAPGGAAQPASVSLGKGAWDCDLNTAIPPEKEVRSAQAHTPIALFATGFRS